MKRFITTFILFTALLVTASGIANASSYYLTLTGNVAGIQDQGGLASAAGVSIGSNVSYILQVDTDKAGTSGGYYASLYSGVLSGTNVKSSSNINTWSTGFNGDVYNDGSSVYINSWSGSFDDLVSGSGINQIYEEAYNSEDNNSYTQLTINNVVVSNISDTAPTPIPAAALIFVGGLGVVGFVKRRFSRQSA